MKHVATDLLEIACFDEGPKTSPAVLLLHGWPDDATTWEKMIPQLLFAGHRVIAPFYRGFGETCFKSKQSRRTGNAGIIAYDMIALMDALDVTAVSVAGHDWGVNIGEAMAIGWPDRVKRLAFLSSIPRLGGLPTPSFQQAMLDWYHWFQATKRGVAAVRKDPIGFGRVMWENWAPGGWFSEETFTNVSASWRNEDFVDVTLHSYQSRWEEAEPDPDSKDLEEKIKSTNFLSLPVLFIQGEEDGVNPPPTGDKVHEQFTGEFKRVLMPSVGHFPSREAPEQLLRHLIPFLRNG